MTPERKRESVLWVMAVAIFGAIGFALVWAMFGGCR